MQYERATGRAPGPEFVAGTAGLRYGRGREMAMPVRVGRPRQLGTGDEQRQGRQWCGSAGPGG